MDNCTAPETSAPLQTDTEININDILKPYLRKWLIFLVYQYVTA